MLAHGGNLNLRGQNGQTALSVAVLKDNVTVVRLLIEHGADVHVKSWDGNSLLATAIEQADDSRLQSAEIVRLLLANGASPNEKCANGATVLSKACELINPDVVSALVNAGADVNAHSPANDMTPLEQSIRQGQMGVFKLLLSHGADANAYSKYESSPLYMTAQYKRPDMAVLLLAHGANPNFINDFEMCSPALVIAAARDDAKMVSLLLTHGADANLADTQDGQTALIASAGTDLWDEYSTRHKNQSGTGIINPEDALDLRTATKPTDLTVPQLLLAHKADPDAADWSHNTALSLAVLGRKTALVKILMAHGAHTDMSVKNIPLKILAAQRGYKDIVYLLNSIPTKHPEVLHQTEAVPTPAGAGQPKAA